MDCPVATVPRTGLAIIPPWGVTAELSNEDISDGEAGEGGSSGCDDDGRDAVSTNAG